jgi:hypothetical protein
MLRKTRRSEVYVMFELKILNKLFSALRIRHSGLTEKKNKTQVLVINTDFVTARGKECISCWEGYRCMCPFVLLQKVG